VRRFAHRRVSPDADPSRAPARIAVDAPPGYVGECLRSGVPGGSGAGPVAADHCAAAAPLATDSRADPRGGGNEPVAAAAAPCRPRRADPAVAARPAMVAARHPCRRRRRHGYPPAACRK